MTVVRAAEAVRVRGARYRDEVVALEKPVDILKADALEVGVAQHHCPHFPAAQVRRGGEREGVSRALGIVIAVIGIHEV